MKISSILTHICLIGICVTAIIVSGSTSFAEESAKKAAELKPQETCPIMGGKIDKTLFVDAKGKRIYVCCGGCVAAVKKDPEGALKKLAKLGEKAEDIPIEQKTCPVMGGPINKDLFVEYKGKKIYVCCEGCINVVKKDPEKYAKKVAEEIAKNKTEEAKKDKAEKSDSK